MRDQFKAKSEHSQEPSTFEIILVSLVTLSIVIGMIAAVYYMDDIFRWYDGLYKVVDVLHVYQADGRWYKAQAKNFEPVTIDLSSGGVVWLSSKQPFRGLAAYYPNDEDDEPLFYRTSSIVRDVALVDETLWAVTNNEVLHFDGTTWTSYPEGVATIKSSSLVANQDNVWLIDDWGHLSHFDGTTWTISDLKESLPEGEWSRPFASFRDDPQLALTADGKLWLAYNRLWYWDGEQWRETSPPEQSSDNIGIVAVTEAGLWVHTNALWLWDGEKWREGMEVLGAQAGFPTGQTVITIKSLGNLITTNEGIFIRTDSEWQLLPSPEGSFPRPKEIGMRPDGTIWGIFSPQRTLWEIFKPLVAQLLFFAALGVIGRFVLPQLIPFEVQAEEKDENLVWHKMIRAFFGDLLRPLLLVIMIAGPPLLLFWIWPDVPLWLLLGVGVLLLWLAPPIVRRLFARWQGKSEQKSLSRELIERAGLALLSVGGVIGFNLVLEWSFSRNWPTHMILLPLSVLMMLLTIFVIFGVIWWNNRALKQGDYDKALRQIRERRGIQAQDAALVAQREVPILLLAGRHLEAEQQIQQVLNKLRENSLKWTRHSLLALLGYAYLGQERYPEAMRAFEEALEGQAITNESYALNGLAEVYLRQGNDPARALDLLDMALQKKPSSFLPRLLRADDITGQIIANRAWAFAQQRRHLEAERVLDEAFQKVDSNSKPHLAAVHYRAAHVLHLRGNKQAALEHARTAQELDPHGDAGRLAAQGFR